MKIETLAKIAIASALCAPACSTVEQGVIICKQDLPEENALYVNLVRKNKAKQKPLHDQSNEISDADRKLFFADSTYRGLFDYALVGDTISFRNPSRATYIDVNKSNVIRSINGVREREIINMISQKQK